jgi:hypothetical protein
MRRQSAACLALGILGASCLQAAELSGEVGIGAIYTDNILLTPTNTQGDTVGVASTDFLLHEDTRRLVGEVAANLQYLTYEHDIYHNEVLGDLTGLGKFAVIPGRFDWVLQDNFGQQEITPGTPATPLNLENINYVSTGPDFSLPIGRQLLGQLSARYSKVSYQLNDLNNNRGDASVALVHPLSASSNVSLNASAERVVYDDSLVNPDYTTRQGYVHFDAQGSRSKLMVDAGYANSTIANQKSGGALVRATISRTISTSTSFELSAGQDISDTGNLLRQMQGTSNVTLGAAALQSAQDPFTNRFATAAWRFDRHRTGLSLALSQFRERHTEESDLNRTRTELDAGARRNLSETLIANVDVRYARESFVSSITPNDTDLRATADLAWRLGRRIEVHAQFARVDHRSDALVDSYLENRYMLTVGLATEKRTGAIPISSPSVGDQSEPTGP